MSFIVSSTIYLVTIPIFIEAFGSILLGNACRGESRLLFFYTTVVSQLIYSVCTKFREGFIILPLVDGIQSIKNIVNNYEEGNIINPLICYALASIILFLACAGKYLNILPRSVQCAMFLCNGTLMVLGGCYMLFHPDNLLCSISHSIISCGISILGMYICRAKGMVHLLFYMLGIRYSLNTISYVFPRFNHLLFNQDIINPLSFLRFYKKIDISQVDLQIYCPLYF
eukprot:GHVR01056265.1.p1 GENE.GHVR01056265.1~~GHVR01056265.1.p1  ORF type:complete len:227 (+),score=-9.59 GHVR01056265.1:26-706(+)